MRPIDFKERNVIYVVDQPEYISLPAYQSPLPEGYVISCWKLTFVERLRVLFMGKMWMNLMMFHEPLTPSLLFTKQSDAFSCAEYNSDILNNTDNEKSNS